MNRLNTENVFEDLDGLAEVEVARGLQLASRKAPPSLSRRSRCCPFACPCVSVAPLVTLFGLCRTAGVLAEQQERGAGDVVLRSEGAQPDQPEHAAVSARTTHAAHTAQHLARLTKRGVRRQVWGEFHRV